MNQLKRLVKRRWQLSLLIAIAAVLLYSTGVIAATYISNWTTLGDGTLAWYALGNNGPSWQWLGSSTLYTTVSGRISLNLVLAFAVAVILILLMSLALYISAASNGVNTSPSLLIIEVTIAAIISIIGIVVFINMLMEVRFV